MSVAAEEEEGYSWYRGSLGKEVEALVEYWYRRRGQLVPLKERGVAAEIDAQEAARLKQDMECSEVAEGEVKPAFGTPEFWKWHAAKKAAAGEVVEKKPKAVTKPSPKDAAHTTQ